MTEFRRFEQNVDRSDLKVKLGRTEINLCILAHLQDLTMDDVFDELCLIFVSVFSHHSPNLAVMLPKRYRGCLYLYRKVMTCANHTKCMGMYESCDINLRRMFPNLRFAAITLAGINEYVFCLM